MPPRSRQTKQKNPPRYDGFSRLQDSLSARLTNQFLDTFLRFGICAFSHMSESYPTAFVNQVHRWPSPSVISLPIGKVIVQCDRVRDIQSADRVLHIRRVMFIIKFRRVHTENHQTLSAVTLMPLPQTRQFVLTVDSAKGPELDQHDLPAQVVPIQFWGIEPCIALDARCNWIIRVRPLI